MKKLTALMLAMVMILGMFAGCGSDTSEPSTPSTPATSLLPGPHSCLSCQLLTEAASAWEADLPMPSPASSHCIT